VAAVAANPGWQVEALVGQVADQGALALATVGVVDPGNLGTLLRSAVAFGASALFALEGSAEPTHPKVLRAAAGHLLPAARGHWAEFRDRCREHGVTVVAVDLAAPDDDAAVDLSALSVDPSQATVVCVGAEGRGFPEGASGFDRRVRIPMQPRADSLNAGVAGSLLLWTLRR
jgi:TrmH family RNA methyltransferase